MAPLRRAPFPYDLERGGKKQVYSGPVHRFVARGGGGGNTALFMDESALQPMAHDQSSAAALGWDGASRLKTCKTQDRGPPEASAGPRPRA